MIYCLFLICPSLFFHNSLFCQMTNDHLHIIYHRGYQKYIFFAFQASPKSSSECSQANKRWFKRKFGTKRGALQKWRTCLASRRPCRIGLMRWLSPERWTIPCNHHSEMNRCRARARLLTSLFHAVHWVPLGGVRSCATDPLTQNTTRPICGNRAHRNIFAVYAVDWETLSETATTLVLRSPQSSSSWPGSPKADGLEWRHSIWPNMSHYTLT